MSETAIPKYSIAEELIWNFFKIPRKISVVEIIFSTVAGGNTVTSLITGLQQGFFPWRFPKFLGQLFPEHTCILLLLFFIMIQNHNKLLATWVTYHLPLMSPPWTKDVNWTYIRRSIDVQNFFWTSLYVQLRLFAQGVFSSFSLKTGPLRVPQNCARLDFPTR